MLVPQTVGEPDRLPHAELRRELAREGGGTPQVVLAARARFTEHQLLGGPSTEEAVHLVEELRARQQSAVAQRELQRVPERGASARHDADLAHRVGVGAPRGDERVPGFVHGHAELLVVREPAAAALGPGHHALDRVLEIPLRHALAAFVAPAPDGEERRFVDGVREIRPDEARGRAGEPLQVDARGERHLAGVHAQDRFAAHDVRRVQHDLAVEAPGPQQGRVEDVGAGSWRRAGSRRSSARSRRARRAAG